jgi:hypothetical protein
MKNHRYIPPSPDPVKVQLSGIPKGYLGTKKTLENIQKLILRGAKDFFVRQKAIDILLENQIKPKDYSGEINALFQWVQQNIRYTKDIYRVELLHTPRRMLELRAGDCDDMAILLGSMLESIGHPIRLVIMGPDSSKPKFFSHIYLEVNLRGRWIPLDATMSFPMGWAPKARVKEIASLDHARSQKSLSSGIGAFEEDDQSHSWLAKLFVDFYHEGLKAGDQRIQKIILILKDKGIFTQKPRLQLILGRMLRQGVEDGRRGLAAKWLFHLLRQNKVLTKESTDRIQAQLQFLQSKNNRSYRLQEMRLNRGLNITSLGQVKECG